MLLLEKIKQKNLFQLALSLQGIASFLALTVYAYLGSFSRLIADDYYHSYLLQGEPSLWQVSIEKYLYVSNRYTTMSFFSFGEQLGIKWISGVMLFLWLLGLIWFLHELKQILGVHLSYRTIFALATSLVFLSILQAPNRYQTIYWLSGSQTYFAPLVFLAYFFAILLTFLKHSRSKTALIFIILFTAMVSFLIGGLSETVGALHIGILSLAILAFQIWGKKANRKTALLLLGAALLGVLFSLLVMALSPANAIRSSAAPIAIPVFLQRIVVFSYGFIIDTLKTLPLPSFFTVFLTFLIFSSFPSSLKEKKIIFWGLALTPILMYALIALSFAPSAYALSYPDARVRFPARVVMTSAFFIEGALLGMLFQVKEKILVVLLLIGAAIYPLRGAWQAYQTLPKFQAYAEAWDTRNAYILSKKIDGIMKVAVPPIGGIAGIKEFDIDPKHWVNQAAAQYYGVDAISVHSSDLSYDE